MAKTDTTSTTASASSASANGSTNNRAADAYRSAREKTSGAFTGVRDSAGNYTRKVSSQVTANPVGALAGGFAVGALIGALLPRTESEQRYLAGTGRKLTDAARSAASTAVESSRDKIDQATGSVVNKLGAAALEAVGQQGS